MSQPQTGSIPWIDLTVRDAERIRDFYQAVVGWSVESVDMNGYEDFNMTRPTVGEPAAGICHARGANADLPPVWMAYITVADLDQSLAACRELGGEIVTGPKGLGSHGCYAVIRDPADAVIALFEPAGVG